MLTQAQQVITLRSRYAVEEGLQEVDTIDEQLRHQRFGKLHILALVRRKLLSIRIDTDPDQGEKRVVSLLNWLIRQKMCWMSGQRRRRSSHDMWKAWQVEGAINQIDTLLLELCQTFSSRWELSSARHGRGFQVFHCCDSITGSTSVDIARQYWCGPQRNLWYQEVAIVSLKRAEQQLEEIFQLTNHIDQPWPHHREIVWSLDMHALATNIARQQGQAVPISTGPSYPRSTSVGDIVVSLLSGTAWIVAPLGFQVITLAEDVPEASLEPIKREDLSGDD